MSRARAIVACRSAGVEPGPAAAAGSNPYSGSDHREEHGRGDSPGSMGSAGSRRCPTGMAGE